MTYVTNNNVRDRNLFDLALPYNCELVLALYPALQAAELPLLGVIIEGSHDNNDYDRDEDGQALDPSILGLILIDQGFCKGVKKEVKTSDIYVGRSKKER